MRYNFRNSYHKASQWAHHHTVVTIVWLCIFSAMASWQLLMPNFSTYAAYSPTWCQDNVGSIDLPLQECETLVQLYVDAGGDNWNTNNGWFDTTTMCDWHGIGCTYLNQVCIDEYINPCGPDSYYECTEYDEEDNCITEEQVCVPESWCNMYQDTDPVVGDITLSNNNLSGTIDLSGLQYINSININGNQITALDTSDNMSLTDINVSNNPSISMDLIDNINVESLYVTNNGFTVFPDTITNLLNLKYLSISHNNISSIPPEIEYLVDLESLNVANNNITELPLEIANLDNLNDLRLDNNGFTVFPEVINILTWLTYLSFANNSVSSINITGLTTLFTLFINDNDIQSLDLSTNTNLRYLHAYNNNIQSLDLSTNTNLRQAYFQNNNIDNLTVTNYENYYVDRSWTCVDEVRNPNLNCTDMWYNDCYRDEDLQEEVCQWVEDIQCTGDYECMMYDWVVNYDLDIDFYNNCLAPQDQNALDFLNTYDISNWSNDQDNCFVSEPVLCEDEQANNFWQEWQCTYDEPESPSWYTPGRCMMYSGSIDVPVSECEALEAIYTTTNGSDWIAHNRFSTTTICGFWSDIWCSLTWHIINLDLASNQLSGYIPDEIGNLVFLQNLELQWNNLVWPLPSSIGNLSLLEEIRLYDNQITELPNEIGNLTNLRILRLSNNNISDIPSSIANLSLLEQLHIDGNNLSSLSDQIWGLTSLSYINIMDNNITTLPSTFWNLSSLVVAAIGYNPITSLPDQIGNLSTLEELYIYNGDLTELPNTISNLSNLKKLRLDYNELTSLPNWFDNLYNLWELYLSSNDFEEVPEMIYNMTGLTMFTIESNDISSVGTGIGNLINLVVIWLGWNNLTSLPDEIGNLINIYQFDIRSNHITTLPSTMNTSNWNNITNLLVDYNCIDEQTLSQDTLDMLNMLHPNRLDYQTSCDWWWEGWWGGDWGWSGDSNTWALTITKTFYEGDTTWLTLGDNQQYFEISYYNDTDQDLENVIIRDYMPEGVHIWDADPMYDAYVTTGTSYALTGDVCFDQFWNETGPYHDALEALFQWAFGMSIYDAEVLLLWYTGTVQWSNEFFYDAVCVAQQWLPNIADCFEQLDLPGWDEYDGFDVSTVDASCGLVSELDTPYYQWNIGWLSNDTSDEIYAYVSIDTWFDAVPGYMFTNVADVSDGNLFASGIATALYYPAPNLIVTKQADVTGADVGDTINYVITVTNNGTATATGVQLMDFFNTTQNIFLEYTDSDIPYTSIIPVAYTYEYGVPGDVCFDQFLDAQWPYYDMLDQFFQLSQGTTFLQVALSNGYVWSAGGEAQWLYEVACPMFVGVEWLRNCLLNIWWPGAWFDIIETPGCGLQWDFDAPESYIWSLDSIAVGQSVQINVSATVTSVLEDAWYPEGTEIINVACIKKSYSNDCIMQTLAGSVVYYDQSQGGWWSDDNDSPPRSSWPRSSTDFDKQICTIRDCSDSYYDGICGVCTAKDLVQHYSAQAEHLVDNTLAFLAKVADVIKNTQQSYDQELIEAYVFARDLGITTIDNIDDTMMFNPLIRKHLAKMMSMYAVKVLWAKPDTTRNCVFADMSTEDEEMKLYARLACQLGFMWLEYNGKTPQKNFNPNALVTRDQFGTVMSRVLYAWQVQWDTSCWYCAHLQALKTDGIMNQIDVPTQEEVRWYVMLMMYRAYQKRAQ